MAQLFIRRPVLAVVLALLICLVGTVSLLGLPVEQYPALAPPNIRVQAIYPGAGAEVVEQSVATAVEQEANGVDGMLYMKSLNSSDGRMLLDVTFEVGTDQDVANTLTQNRVEPAQARLPPEVLAQGITVKKLNPSILMVITLTAPHGSHDALFLNNYAMLNVRNELQRIKGVAQVDLGSGGEYGMRVWLRPDELVRLRMTPSDVIAALREQNIQAPAGQVGGAPSPTDQQFTYTVRAPGKLATPEAFGNVIVKAMPDGRQVRVRDVARVELGSEFYKSFARLDGKPTAPLLVYMLPGANQIETASTIYGAMKSLAGSFPEDLAYQIPYDTTPAVEASIEGIQSTLLEAVVLVVLVVFLFLQSWRATLIPLLTVPVSLLGTFAVFSALGFSVNTLSLFGMVLAIGIVVDDAIVVVEAVVHHIEHGLSPREATVQAMREVSGPVIGVALVLTSVFVPVAFLGGLTGRLYQQFALTIAVAVLFSALAALTIAPALSAVLLKPRPEGGGRGRRFFAGFDKLFGKLTNGYVRAAGSLARRATFSLVLVALAAAGTGGLNSLLPGGFVPEEDQGLLAVNLQLPNAAALSRTEEASRQVEKILASTPGIESYLAIGGLSVISNSFAPYNATFFAKLKPWDERVARGQSFGSIMQQLGRRLYGVKEGIAFPFSIPPLPGFGAAGGVTFMLQDRSGSRSVAEMGQQVGAFVEAAKQRPELARLFTAFDPTVPQIALDVDRDKARKLGVPITDVFATLQTTFGGTYVNDFNRFGRIYRVFVQAEADKRRAPSDLAQLEVRSASTGVMVPLSTLVTLRPSTGAELTTRYNLYRSVEVVGAVAPGYSSGQAMGALEELAETVLPADMRLDYTGISYQEKNAPNPLPTFGIAIVVVFLLLAALYESWSLPVSVLLGTPFVALGAFLGVWLRDYDYNVFVQVGVIMLIGLAAKNAILIVEFAKLRREQGSDPVSAALEAARLRFRPIVMTALAFIIGVIPLMYATGSGSVARRVMGTTVCFGMLVATILGVLVVPAFYVLVEKLRSRLSGGRADAQVVAAPAE